MARSDRSEDKVPHLRAHGALNPRPERVTDEEFLSSDFFDSRDLLQVKYEMLRRVERESQSVSKTAASFGLSRPTFYQAQVALTEGGLPGLLPRRRGPKGAHKLTEEVMASIEQALEEDDSLRGPQLAEMVRDRFGISVHPRSIDRGLTRLREKNSTRSRESKADA